MFEFDATTLELWKNGRAVRIRPQSLKVLTLLLAKPGALVSRTELQNTVWGADTVVDFEQGVNQCIKDLRAALGDDAESPRYIETLAKRGYRFIAPVEAISASPPEVTERVSLPQHVETSAGGKPLATTPVFPLPRADQSRSRSVAMLGLVLAAVLAAMVIGPYALRRGGRPVPRASIVSVLPFSTQQAHPALGIGLADAISSRLSGQHL